MGSRGASSGWYRRHKKWYRYGEEYHTVLQERNIKFVKINEGSTTAPMETMTQGRVYVTVTEDNKLKSITYYTATGKRRKQIDLDHPHFVDGKIEQPHTHIGYIHSENGDRKPTKKEQRMIDFVYKVWNNRNKQ